MDIRKALIVAVLVAGCLLVTAEHEVEVVPALSEATSLLEVAEVENGPIDAIKGLFGGKKPSENPASPSADPCATGTEPKKKGMSTKKKLAIGLAVAGAGLFLLHRHRKNKKKKALEAKIRARRRARRRGRYGGSGGRRGYRPKKKKGMSTTKKLLLGGALIGGAVLAKKAYDKRKQKKAGLAKAEAEAKAKCAAVAAAATAAILPASSKKPPTHGKYCNDKTSETDLTANTATVDDVDKSCKTLKQCFKTSKIMWDCDCYKTASGAFPSAGDKKAEFEAFIKEGQCACGVAGGFVDTYSKCDDATKAANKKKAADDAAKKASNPPPSTDAPTPTPPEGAKKGMMASLMSKVTSL